MSKIQSFILVLVVICIGLLVAVQNRTRGKLRAENESLRQRLERLEQVDAENRRLSNLLARASASEPKTSPGGGTNDQFRELMKLRGEVGVLRQAVNEANSEAAKVTNSVMSGLTANPEMYQMIRDQQKTGLGMIYRDFTRKMNLSEAQSQQLTETLADHVMVNIDHITAGLREGKSAVEMDRTFAAQEAALKEKVQALLGPEGAAQYEDYNRNLLSHITAQQFKSMMLTGEGQAKEEKARQLYAILQEESRNALRDAGLPADYQTIPTLNFRNFASDQAGEQGLQLMDNIYERVAGRAATVLEPADLKKFAEFRKMAINNNRVALAVNRKIMAPPSK